MCLVCVVMADFEDRFVINIRVSENCYTSFIRHVKNIFMAQSCQLPFLHMFVECLINVLKEDNGVIMHWFVCTKVSVTKETICNIFKNMIESSGYYINNKTLY